MAAAVPSNGILKHISKAPKYFVFLGGTTLSTKSARSFLRFLQALHEERPVNNCCSQLCAIHYQRPNLSSIPNEFGTLFRFEISNGANP